MQVESGYVEQVVENGTAIEFDIVSAGDPGLSGLLEEGRCGPHLTFPPPHF